MKFSSRTKNITTAALIAGMYTALTLVSYAFGLDKGAIQLRLSESLAILPAFTPAAVPGLFVGCFLSSLLCNAHPLDMLLGSLITLAAAMLARFLRRVQSAPLGAFLIPLPNILLNALLIPLLLLGVYGITDGYLFLAFTVGVGEILTSGVLGMILYFVLKKQSKIFRA